MLSVIDTTAINKTHGIYYVNLRKKAGEPNEHGNNPFDSFFHTNLFKSSVKLITSLHLCLSSKRLHF